ncbi:MAG TPA: hypothetical protein VFU12_12680 [Glycomyces sp.]|nr:hypothetical protein [Glycomyces sp.]
MDTLMWEAKARAGRGGALLEWVRAEGVAGLGDTVRAEVFAAAERVVVVVVGPGAPRSLPEPPADLVERPPHAWPFTRVMTDEARPER